MTKICLGFHYHVPALTRENGIYTSGPIGCFIDSIASVCEKMTCFLHSPRIDEFPLMDYRIAAKNVELIDIGPHVSVPTRFLHARKYLKIIQKHTNGLNLLLLRGPSPLLPILVSGSAIPTALLLVGDYLTGVSDLPQPWWRKQVIRLWALWNKVGQDRAAQRSLTFVNSRILYNELKNKVPRLHEIPTTTLMRSDFFIREDTCQSNPIQLLYVGRMDRSKGLLEMIDAIALLKRQGENIKLNLVGWLERGDPVLNEIQILARELGVDGNIHYLGSRPLGPALFECYRQADIFIIASLASEGFPRTIWEAMAHSLPVVATRVGSIPHFVEGEVELIPPRNVIELANAISRLIHDGNRRRQLIISGRKLAQENTLEKRAREMMDIIHAYVQQVDQ